MKKFLLCLTMALLIAVIAPISVFAKEDHSYGNAVFDGKAINTDFNKNMDSKLMGIQPGDTYIMHVTIKNSYSEKTNWYMANEVLQSLEQTKKMDGIGSYTYLLTYKDSKNNSVTLFNSNTVGAESSIGGVGLNQATNALKDYFFLDELEPNETGEVTLKVVLEGETQGNEYQDTLARLQMKFAVELARAPGKIIYSAPRTGDAANIMAYSMVALGAGVICVILVLFRVKNNRKEAKVQRGGR